MPTNTVEIRDNLPETPEASEFPNALAAMERTEESLQKAESQAQWAVGDGVLQDVPIQPSGVKDGSHDRLRRLAAVAEARGYPRYTVVYLRRLRLVSARFPGDRRRTPCSWTIHEEAGDPDTLDEIIEIAEAEGVPVTFRYARTKKRQIEEERTRTTSAGDLGATTQAGPNVIPISPLRTKRPSWKEQAADLKEELQEKEEEIQRKDLHIASLEELVQNAEDYYLKPERAREHPSPTPAITKAITRENDDSIHADVVDNSQQAMSPEQTVSRVFSAEQPKQAVAPEGELLEGLKPELLDVINNLVDIFFDDIVNQYDLSDAEQRQAARYLFEQILKRVHNGTRGA